MPKDRSGYVFQDKQGRWYARTTVTDRHGNRRNIKRSAKDKADAKQILKTILRQIEDEGEKGVDASRMTFNALADFYEKHYLHPAQYRDQKKISGLRAWDRAQAALVQFRRHFGRMRVREITHGDINSYRVMRLNTPTRYNRSRTIAGMNRELVVLRRIFSIGVREGFLLKSPFSSGDPLICAADETKRDRILSRDEEARILAAIDREPKRQHIRGIFLCGVDLALRRGEIFTLRWSDVDFARRVVTVRAFNCKTARSRTVALTLRLYEWLLRWYEARATDRDSLVFGVTVTIKTAWQKICREAGVEDCHFHDTRATCITRMIEAGMPPAAVMRVSGHTTLAAFYTYVRANESAIFRAAAALDSYHAQAAEGQPTIASELAN
jgi:integrase